MNRIKWSSDEIDKIAARAMELGQGDGKWLKWIRKAQQEVLPANRQRNLLHNQHCRVVLEAIKSTRGVSEAEGAQRASEAPVEPPTTKELSQEEMIEQITSRTAERILQLLVERLSRADPPHVAAAVQRFVAEQAPPVSEAEEAEEAIATSSRLAKVAVVGYDSREQEQIARGLRGFAIKLIFAHPHHHSKSQKLVEKVANCEMIFVRVKYIAHAHVDALKSRLANKCRWLENQPNAINCSEVIRQWAKNRGLEGHGLTP